MNCFEKRCLKLFGSSMLIANFIGHFVTKEGIRLTKEKIETISKFPLPSNTKQLQRYIGLNQFVHYAAELLGPLIDMLAGKPKTDKKLVWTSDCEVMFNQTKNILSQALLLVCPVINAPTSLMIDASNVVIGGVLQICLKGIWPSIAFFSRRLTPAQHKYSAFDRELLAMYLIVQHFYILLKERNLLS